MSNNIKKDSAYECAQREFYENVKDKRDEVEKVLEEAQNRGWHSFKTWYTQEYDWRFLNDVLGGVKDPRLSPFDYCRLIHVPKFQWTDSEGKEHTVEFSGTHSPDYYGFTVSELEDGDGTKVSSRYDEEKDITVWKVDNDLLMSEDSATGTYNVLGSIEYKGQIWNIPGAIDVSGCATKDYVNTKASETLQSAKDYTDEAVATSSAKFLGTYTGGDTRPESFDFDAFLKSQIEVTPTNNDYAYILWTEEGLYDRCKYVASSERFEYEFTFTGDVSNLKTRVSALEVNKLDASKSTTSTTLPTEPATDGGIHIIYCETEPETKYAGYIYFVKED